MNSSNKKLRGWRPPTSVIPYIGMTVDWRPSFRSKRVQEPPRVHLGIEGLESRLNRDIKKIWRDTDPDSGEERIRHGGDERHQQVEVYLEVFRTLTSIGEVV